MSDEIESAFEGLSSFPNPRIALAKTIATAAELARGSAEWQAFFAGINDILKSRSRRGTGTSEDEDALLDALAAEGSSAVEVLAQAMAWMREHPSPDAGEFSSTLLKYLGDTQTLLSVTVEASLEESDAELEIFKSTVRDLLTKLESDQQAIE
jgi:hypothetical protein